jgi:tRNA (Thr-GGU) A37 N-methylase
MSLQRTPQFTANHNHAWALTVKKLGNMGSPRDGVLAKRSRSREVLTDLSESWSNVLAVLAQRLHMR